MQFRQNPIHGFVEGQGQFTELEYNDVNINGCRVEEEKIIIIENIIVIRMNYS